MNLSENIKDQIDRALGEGLLASVLGTDLQNPEQGEDVSTRSLGELCNNVFGGQERSHGEDRGLC